MRKGNLNADMYMWKKDYLMAEEDQYLEVKENSLKK
jgi:hypothetical protein